MKHLALIAVAAALVAGCTTASTETAATDAVPAPAGTGAVAQAEAVVPASTPEITETSGKDQIRGAGDEIAGNEDRAWREQITCKTQSVTGSRIVKERVCRTNAQWQAQQEENQRSIRNVTMGQSGEPG